MAIDMTDEMLPELARNARCQLDERRFWLPDR